MRKDLYRCFIPIILLSIIGIISILLSKNIINNYYSFFTKQIIYVIIGIIMFFLCIKINYNNINKYILLFYFISICLLLYVLLFGKVINGSRAWISIFSFSIQPSEFAKVSLLLCLNKYIKRKHGLLISFILVLIPSILTFLEPDTGTVLFYLIIYFSIFISLDLNKKYYIIFFSIAIFLCTMFFYLYFFNSETFIKVFGTSFFYRVDRIINFMNSEGYQINNALISIGNGNVFGNGSKYIIYIPEAITDFMYANILTIFGFIGGIIILLLFIYIDIILIKNIKYNKNNKYYVIGLFGLFLYQQVEHILMDIGLLPITGITLPFVSYGGSSLISYYILFGIFLNIKKYQIDT